MFGTSRLILRGLDQDADLTALVNWCGDAETMALMGRGPLVPTSRDQAKQFFLPRPTGQDLPLFAICEKQPDRSYPLELGADEDYIKACGPAIGILNFQPVKFDYKNRIATLGLVIQDKQHRGKGYGKEVLLWGLEYAFMELGLHRMQLEVYSFNEPAIQLYRKAGFVEEGRMRKVYFKGGEWYDVICMAILEEEWMELRKKLQK
ncbi:hypothetical protein LTR85_002154 [Meristemomyces frigidus]|nr:hypothetical protein LTR85_002154 [Meristemomyces frigidus]